MLTRRDASGETARGRISTAAAAAWRAALATGLAALAAAALPAAAEATATIGPTSISVQGEGAGAVIRRSPLGIAFTDAGGHTVLSEVANTGAAALTLPPTLPGMPSEPTGPTLYSPLTFLVGSAGPATYTGYSLAGDLLSAEESGIEYSAREVLTATVSGEGVTMTVSTDDPTGRQLTVTVAPDRAGAIRVTAVPSDPTGVAAMADSFSSPSGESFDGFGGRHNALDQHGQDFYNWVDQENIRTGSPGEGAGEDNLTPDGPQAAYYVQSSFISNAGYGFLLDRSELSRWRLDSDRPDAWQTQVAAPAISYVVAPGSMPAAISTLTGINGRQRVPPTWALGPEFDREVGFESAGAYEKAVTSDLAKIALHRLPVASYRIEGYGWVKQAFLESTIATLRERGIHPLLYLRSFVGQEKIGTEDPAEFTTAVEHGYVATTAGGQPYTFTDNFSEPAAVIDFTNPAAVQWWTERVDRALELGADGFMLDFGEQVQPDMHFSDGSTGAQMHNRYPILVQRVTREAVDAYEASHPGRQIIFFTRSGYSGDPGSAAYENFNFPGDETTDWSTASGLASLTRDMLNRAIGGAFGYGTDIGGYWDIGVKPTTSELLLRWAAWAALSPVFRLHGAVLDGEHTPWSYPNPSPIVSAYKLLSELHASAAPLISALWKQAAETGMPITRPLYLAYPEDAQAALQDQEWLLGPDVLVAPIVEQGAVSRQVYFPSGCWRSPATGQQVSGPQYTTVSATVGQLPFFFHCATRPFTPPRPFALALRR